MSRSFHDAIVIGGDFAGLAAASYLVRAGMRVLVLEKRGAIASGPRKIFALDPQVAADLELERRGLAIAAPDLPLVGLRRDGAHIILSRDHRITERSIAVHSRADAERFFSYRRSQLALARSLQRRGWDSAPPRLLWPSQRALLEELQVASAEAFLASCFESDVMRALLAFDAGADGVSPCEAGSALLPVWRAAQEVDTLQGVTALTAGDTLMTAVRRAASGAEIRCNAMVAAVLARDSAVTGVRLVDGEEIVTPIVLSSLSRAASRLLAPVTGLAEHADAVRHQRLVSDAHLTITLETDFSVPGAPDNARFVICGAQGHAQARQGLLPTEPHLEFSRIAEQTITVIARPDPINPREGWKECGPRLAALCILAMTRYLGAMKPTAIRIAAPQPDDKPVSVLAPWRNETGLYGYLLCGDGIGPVTALSGRAARPPPPESKFQIFV